jgi:hypothetical protein
MCGGHRWRYWATGLPGWMTPGAWGWGRGWGHPWHDPWHGHGPYAYGQWVGAGPYVFGLWRGEPTAKDELAFLKEEAESHRHYLEGIERRITELERASVIRDAA